jgi:hypothetical protein
VDRLESAREIETDPFEALDLYGEPSGRSDVARPGGFSFSRATEASRLTRRRLRRLRREEKQGKDHVAPID